MLQKGQKVRLNYRSVQFHLNKPSQRRHGPDWVSRIGRIARLTRGKTHALIIWDGNRSLSDAMPLDFLEMIELGTAREAASEV
jgi:hypothetical protein